MMRAILVSNQVGLWYNLQHNPTPIKSSGNTVSNQVGLWYNLQLNVTSLEDVAEKLFQTKLDCGIICN